MRSLLYFHYKISFVCKIIQKFQNFAEDQDTQIEQLVLQIIKDFLNKIK